MAATSSSANKPSLFPNNPPQFTPIEEGNEDEEFSQGRLSYGATPASENTERRDYDYSNGKHQATPSHSEKCRSKGSSRKRSEAGESTAVSCNKCRPSSREKISVVPLDQRPSTASPNGIFRSILSSLSYRRSPRLSSESAAASASSAGSRDEHWKIVVAELSNKLIQATRKRDEAILEASKLKCSMAELEKKLNKLEIYCHSLKSGVENCGSSGSGSNSHHHNKQHKSPSRLSFHREIIHDHDKVIEHFLVAVSESRSTVRILSRALALQLRHIGSKVYDRISVLLQPYDVKISGSRNPLGLLFYIEALLNRALYEDFESIGFQKNATKLVLNPIDNCEANFAMFSRLQGLTWEEVLNKGTKQFSEEFSKFCDRKMSEIVAMLGWSKAWPEALLQAFFGASKAVWLVHLLANSVHPSLPVFRVNKGVGFDPVYMEDMGGDKARMLIPTMVKIMVTPGFYIYDNVVKCKVLCRYYNHSNGGNLSELFDKGFTPSPSYHVMES